VLDAQVGVQIARVTLFRPIVTGKSQMENVRFQTPQLRVHLISSLFGLLVAGVVLGASGNSYAACQFNADKRGVSTGTATTDGLLLLRTLMGLSGPARSTNAVHPGGTDSDVADYLLATGLGLDVDGDKAISEVDIFVVTRYLFGFRGDALVAGLTVPIAATRKTGTDIQAFLDNGCVDGPNPNVGVLVWNAMNVELARGTAAGVTAARQYMTDTAIENYAAALTSIAADLPGLISTYSPLTPRVVERDYADYWLSVPVIGSSTGERLVHLVTFLRMPDGTWLVDAM